MDDVKADKSKNGNLSYYFRKIEILLPYHALIQHLIAWNILYKIDTWRIFGKIDYRAFCIIKWSTYYQHAQHVINKKVAWRNACIWNGNGKMTVVGIGYNL